MGLYFLLPYSEIFHSGVFHTLPVVDISSVKYDRARRESKFKRLPINFPEFTPFREKQKGVTVRTAVLVIDYVYVLQCILIIALAKKIVKIFFNVGICYRVIGKHFRIFNRHASNVDERRCLPNVIGFRLERGTPNENVFLVKSS